MDDINRRGLLAGLASLSASGAALASGDPVAARVGEITREWRRRERELSLSFVPDGRFSADDPVVVELQAVSAGFSAVHAVHQLAAIPVEDQVHPRVQEALEATAGAFGGALRRCRDLCAAFLEGAGEDDFVQLHGALRVLRLSSAEWDLPPQRQRMLGTAFDLAEDPEDPHARRQLRRVVRRIDKLESLVKRAQQDDRASDLLRPADRALRDRAGRGLARHGRGMRRLASGDPDTNMGMAVLGYVLLGGGYLLAMIGVCQVTCGSPGGTLMILGGLALMGLGLWAAYGSWNGTDADPRKDKRPPLPESTSVGVGVNVHVGEGWVESSLRRSPHEPLRLRARGRVLGPWGWMASPNGDGVAAGPDAPLPGAPELALLAEVAGEVLFVGADGEIPAGSDAPVRFGLNLPRGAAEGALGFVHVAPA